VAAKRSGSPVQSYIAQIFIPGNASAHTARTEIFDEPTRNSDPETKATVPTPTSIPDISGEGGPLVFRLPISISGLARTHRFHCL
jgi:hypothetical protein